MKTKPTKVIFRKYPKGQHGEIIALFPELGATVNNPAHCESYAHIGQHGAASVGLMRYTRPANPEEYAPLKAELERIGYSLRIVKRFTRADYEKRKAQVTR